MSHTTALLMPWPMQPASGVRAASLPLRRSSTVMESCTMSTALCVPSVSSSFQRDSSTRYYNQVVIIVVANELSNEPCMCGDDCLVIIQMNNILNGTLE